MSKNHSDEFNKILRFVASTMRFFSADELNLLVQYEGLKPSHNQICGAIAGAKHRGLIKATDKAKKSALFGKNSIRRTIWKSLIRKEGK